MSASTLISEIGEQEALILNLRPLRGGEVAQAYPLVPATRAPQFSMFRCRIETGGSIPGSVPLKARFLPRPG